MRIVDSLDRLQLEDDLTLNDDVRSKPLIKAFPPADNRDRHLPLRIEPPLKQVIEQNNLIDRLEEPRPKLTMYSDRSVHDLFADSILIHRCDPIYFASENGNSRKIDH